MIRKAYGLVASIALGFGALLGAPSAQATIVQFDYTDVASFGGVDGSSAFGPVTVDGSGMTISSLLGQHMTFNSSAGEAAGCASAV